MSVMPASPVSVESSKFTRRFCSSIFLSSPAMSVRKLALASTPLSAVSGAAMPSAAMTLRGLKLLLASAPLTCMPAVAGVSGGVSAFSAGSEACRRPSVRMPSASSTSAGRLNSPCR